MSLSTLILKPGASHYVIGAYLVLNTILSVIIGLLLPFIFSLDDPVQQFVIGFSCSGILVTTGYYLGVHEFLNQQALQKEEKALPIQPAPRLAEISTLSFMQSSKDAFLGTTIFAADLLLVGLASFLMAPLVAEDNLLLFIILFLTGIIFSFLAHWTRRQAHARKQVYLNRLLLSWRYFILNQTLPGPGGRERERFRQLETYLGLGAWSFATTILGKFIDDLEQALRALTTQIDNAIALVNWCRNPTGSQPQIAGLDRELRILEHLGLRFVELDPANSLLDMVGPETAKSLNNFSSLLLSKKDEELKHEITNYLYLLMNIEPALPEFKERLIQELAAKQYRFGLPDSAK